MEAEMTNAAQIAHRYIAVWNETDPALRRTLADGWAENATDFPDKVPAGA
jgi:hypothetical protein